MKNTQAQKKSNQSHLSDQKGQSLLEFLFLLLILMGLSFTLLKGVNGNIGKRWVALVKIIAGPTGPIELRGGN